MSSSPALRPGEIELGFVSGVFGIKGEVRVHLHNRESHFFKRSKPISLISPSGERREHSLRCRSGAGRRILGTLSDVLRPEEASALKDWLIVIRVDQLPDPEEGQFYVRDIIGATVFCANERVGEVIDVHTNGPSDIFEIRHGEALFFVPAISEFIENLDVKNRELRLLPGALA